MRKTHSANIGGTIFHIEEDAYEKLQGYLQSIHEHFHFYPDVADIVADIEARIAEQLLQREFASQVVRMADVDRVIEAMGRIEQFDEPVAEAGPAVAKVSPGQARKLFRDPDHKVIAGVAAGLAAYLGLPRLLVRIALLMLVLLFGTALVVYLLLWVLVPMASSTTEKLQMRGRPLNLASIDQGVRDGINSIPAATRSAAAEGITAAGSLIHLVVVGIARLLKWAAGIFVVGFAALSVLFLTVSLVVALVNADAPPLHPAIGGFFAAFGEWQQVIKVLFYLVIAIPLVIIIATGLRLFWGANRLNARGLAGMLGVWVVALLATAGIWSSSYAQVRQFTDEYPVMEQAHRGLDRFSMLAATSSPLSDEQSKALLATLLVEYKRRNEESRPYTWRGPRGVLEYEQEIINASEEGDRRIVESARAYLNAKQLAAMQDAMTQDSRRVNADLQVRREDLERRLKKREMEDR
jgi:phage shock protein PspC (stress-responsive transcriptional regulator)